MSPRLTLKFWKQRAAGWIFNYLWRDPESGMADMIERNIMARTTAALMNFLDAESLIHCAFCPERYKLTMYNGQRFCNRHLAAKQSEEQAKANKMREESQQAQKLAIFK